MFDDRDTLVYRDGLARPDVPGQFLVAGKFNAVFQRFRPSGSLVVLFADHPDDDVSSELPTAGIGKILVVQRRADARPEDIGTRVFCPDERLGDFVFFLFSPSIENDLHIEILSKIIKIMQEKKNQKALLGSKDINLLSKKVNKIFQ